MGSVNQYEMFYGKQQVTTSYYGGGGVDLSLVSSLHIQWDSALIANASGITLWASNFPLNGQYPIALSSAVAGEWVQLQPPSGYTAISPAGAATLGASPLIINVPGGIAGAAYIDLGNFAGHMLRVQVVATQAGTLRIHACGKR